MGCLLGNMGNIFPAVLPASGGVKSALSQEVADDFFLRHPTTWDSLEYIDFAYGRAISFLPEDWFISYLPGLIELSVRHNDYDIACAIALEFLNKKFLLRHPFGREQIDLIIEYFSYINNVYEDRQSWLPAGSVLELLAQSSQSSGGQA